jgi:hypothetical protein
MQGIASKNPSPTEIRAAGSVARFASVSFRRVARMLDHNLAHHGLEKLMRGRLMAAHANLVAHIRRGSRSLRRNLLFALRLRSPRDFARCQLRRARSGCGLGTDARPEEQEEQNDCRRGDFPERSDHGFR